MRVVGTKWIAAAIAAMTVSTLVSCGGPDLGSCDMTMLGGSETAPNAGQLVMEKSCAGGRCHSAKAKGAQRVGVPAGLDFDLVPLDTSATERLRVELGQANVHDNVDDIWALVDNGDMPPANQGRELTSADKETMRNWLACGAPVSNAPVTIDDGDGDAGAGDAGDADAGEVVSWNDIYQVLSLQCLACHSSSSGEVAGDGFVFGDSGDACGAYENIVGKMAVTTQGGCAAMSLKLVAESDPDQSLLLQKVEGTQPCGGPMPAGKALGPDNDAVEALRAWIAAGAPAPSGCKL